MTHAFFLKGTQKQSQKKRGGNLFFLKDGPCVKRPIRHCIPRMAEFNNSEGNHSCEDDVNNSEYYDLKDLPSAFRMERTMINSTTELIEFLSETLIYIGGLPLSLSTYFEGKRKGSFARVYISTAGRAQCPFIHSSSTVRVLKENTKIG